ncbi:hypothetical protein E2C01_101259 [Portunus trituberculatus]|uniref:Secreted protein n=1 Tax=Portunus trituberculatus TaxID=210409 RepID=A0A5B7K592_PORTR|nr:hypothetical protein [Portunus trituberculatus]
MFSADKYLPLILLLLLLFRSSPILLLSPLSSLVPSSSNLQFSFRYPHTKVSSKWTTSTKTHCLISIGEKEAPLDAPHPGHSSPHQELRDGTPYTPPA